MQISPHCFALTGFAYIPPWSVNAGIVVGDEKTLIVDSGPTAYVAATIAGYARAARPSNQMLVINTEQHLDHIAGNCHFVDSGIEVYGHPGIHRYDEDMKDDIEEFVASTANPIRRDRREGAILFATTRIVNPTQTIPAEMRFELGGVTAELLLTPGHTPTNLCVYIAGERVLFCGDSIISGYMPNLESGTVENWREWLISLDRIETLDAEVIVCGHGPVLRGSETRREVLRVRTILERAILERRAPTLTV